MEEGYRVFYKHAPKAFPRVKMIEGTLTLKLTRRKGILARAPESIKYIGEIVAILVGLIGIMGALFVAFQFLLTLVGKV